MGIEIERKFLLRDDSWRGTERAALRMTQGYLGGERCSVRVRVAGAAAWLNVKSLTLGVSRSEYEFAIPADEARQMLAEFCPAVLDKVRYRVPFGGHEFEIDEFLGDNAGLVVAEIELSAPDQPFERPPWLGDEVSDDARYYNINLVRAPYRTWSAAPERDAAKQEE
jgi:adenylate cyclase